MRRWLGGCLVALTLSTAVAASAQSKDDVARADALFNAAKALTDSGNYADACAKFAESKRLAPGLGVTLYLADCYERIGRTASAWTEFRAAEGLARDRNDKRAEVARGRAQALEPKLLRLTVTVAPTIPRAGLQLMRDGVPLPEEEWGLPVPVDPGDHVVVVVAPGHAQRNLAVHVGPDKPNATVQVDRLDEGPASTATSTAPTTTAPPTLPGTTSTTAATQSAPMPVDQVTADDPGKTRRWLGIGAVGLGVVGIGVGTAFGLVAKSKLDQSNGGPCDSTDHCSSQGLSLRKDAETAATVSTIGFIAGGVALAAGVVLYITAPRAGASSGLVVAPAPMAGGGGALLRATW